MIPEEAIGVLRDLNPWWADPQVVRPAPPPYRRRAVLEIEARLRSRGKLIEVLRGPRQVGKTTGIQQVIQDLLRGSVPSRDILFIRFDLEVLRECPGGLRAIVHWFADAIMQRRLGSGAEPYIFLDEVHKLRRWDEEVKHLGDTFPVRLVLTGSSSVLVARGGRESLAGRVFSTEIPPFLFREVVEAWKPKLAEAFPPPVRFSAAFEPELRKIAAESMSGSARSATYRPAPVRSRRSSLRGTRAPIQERRARSAITPRVPVTPSTCRRGSPADARPAGPRRSRGPG
ncbi:MAG: AAA family ATPase [candidate division NC10 bacterium]|nr:AAA family ATPase [candidate division NC10 bacterium]